MENNSELKVIKRKKLRKRLLYALAIFAGIIIILVVAAFITAYYRGSKMVKSYLEAKVKEQTRGLYTLQMKDLNLILIPGRIKIEGLSLVPDTARYRELQRTDTISPILLTLHIGKVLVTDFDVLQAINHKEIQLKKIIVETPVIEIDEYDHPPHRAKPAEKHKLKLSLSLPGGLKMVDISQVRLSGGNVLYRDHRNDTLKETAITEFSIEIDKIHIDSIPSSKLFNADDIRVTLKGLEKRSKNGMFTVILGEIGLSTGNREVYLKDFHLKPEYSREDFARKLGYQTDWTELKVGMVTFSNLDIPDLILNEHFHADRLTIDKLEVADYRDKRNPMRKNFRPKMPHQALTALKTQIHIDSVIIMNGKISYSEQVGSHPGTVFFDEVSAIVSPVTNDSALLAKGFTMNLSGSLKLMGTSTLKINIAFPMPEKDGKFSFSGLLTNLDLTLLNPFVSAQVPVDIKSGIVDKLVIPTVYANNKNSQGRLTMYYHNLLINLPPQSDKNWEGIKKSVLSWAANTYVAESNPSRHGKLREGIVYFERDPAKSIFNYLWKSIFSGIKSTVNVNTKEQKEIKKQEKTQEKNKKTRH